MKALLDTGPWVALIDRSESTHAKTVEWFKGFEGTLYTTEAVLTEVLYLLNFSIQAQLGALDFVIQSGVTIVPVDPGSLKTAKRLMKKYADLPMDYADATLVALAMETRVRNIATFDVRDFSVYRAANNEHFELLLS
jgi:uncharacterized protein